MTEVEKKINLKLYLAQRVPGNKDLAQRLEARLDKIWKNVFDGYWPTVEEAKQFDPIFLGNVQTWRLMEMQRAKQLARDLKEAQRTLDGCQNFCDSIDGVFRACISDLSSVVS